MTAPLALLFDLDGTLLDTDHLHHAIFAEILAETGHNLTLEEYKARIMGQPNEAIMTRYFPGREAEHAALADAKEAEFRARLGHGLDPIPGAVALLDWADRHALPRAVVTNAPRENAEAMLRAIGLRDRFDTVVIGAECAAPKPDPEPYRAAMRMLGATPECSIAFEDSGSGIRAAAASGAYTFGLRTGLDDAMLRAAGAQETLADYTDPALWLRLERSTLKTA
ncbi:MAG: HAD-IA family hydrolase [Pseudomonadota bacterium]